MYGQFRKGVTERFHSSVIFQPGNQIDWKAETRIGFNHGIKTQEEEEEEEKKVGLS